MLSWKSAGRGRFIETACGKYLINRAEVMGKYCYMAVIAKNPGRYAAPKKGERYPGESDILHVERGIDPACDSGRLAAVDRCKAACAVFDNYLEVANG